MFFVIFSFLLVATAAHAWQQHNYNEHEYQYRQPSLDLHLDQFWTEFNKGMEEFSRGMDELHRSMEDLHKNYGYRSSIEITNNHYKIKIQLQGYNETDIEVKAKPGSLMIRATHTDEFQNKMMYMDTVNLPENVDPAGEWTYSHGILEIVFKFKNDFQQDNVVWHSINTENKKDETVTDNVVQQTKAQHENNDVVYDSVKQVNT